MKNPPIAIARLAAVILVVTSGLLGVVSAASANVRLPGGDVPFYARLSRTEIYHTNDWAAIAFYRSPECIPVDFNLLDFFDIPRAFGCTPRTTDGFEIWVNGPETDPGPKLTELYGLGAVPVWFVRWSDLQEAIEDGSLTIVELAALDHLVGYASFYQETLRPTPTAKAATFELQAKGRLTDGRSFRFSAQAAAHPGEPAECDIHCLTHIVFK